jgi:hypothetical protein
MSIWIVWATTSESKPDERALYVGDGAACGGEEHRKVLDVAPCGEDDGLAALRGKVYVYLEFLRSPIDTSSSRASRMRMTSPFHESERSSVVEGLRAKARRPKIRTDLRLRDWTSGSRTRKSRPGEVEDRFREGAMRRG